MLSFLRRDADLEPVEQGRDWNLAREARTSVALTGAVEKVVLGVRYRRKSVCKSLIDIDVARGARAAAAAYRKGFFR